MSMAISSSHHQINNHHQVKRYNQPFKKRVVDDAAGAAISEKLLAQIKGYNQGSRNGMDGMGAINTADGGLSNITDSLQRMKDLSLQASNGIYTDEDKAGIQQEIDQLKQHITDVSKNTQFNTKNLIDGSMADMHLALNPQGGGMEIRTTDATLESLGIADYDVTGKFDISKIDDAIAQISDARASLGAQSNALESSINVSNISSENLTSAYSKLSDEDIAKNVGEKKKDDIMQKYDFFLITQQKNQQQYIANMLGA